MEVITIERGVRVVLLKNSECYNFPGNRCVSHGLENFHGVYLSFTQNNAKYWNI